MQLLEWHATGQIGIVDMATGAMTKFGTPGMITAVDMNPTGKYARVTRMTKPFSYIVPQSSFGSIEEDLGRDRHGAREAERAAAESRRAGGHRIRSSIRRIRRPQPRRAGGGGGGGRGGGGAAANNGKRELTWRADGQGFNYLQLEPRRLRRGGRGGPAVAAAAAAVADARRRPAAVQGQAARRGGGRGAQQAQRRQKPPRKDRLMQWLPPFSETSTKLIYENPTQMTNVRFSPDGQIMFFTEARQQHRRRCT